MNKFRNFPWWLPTGVTMTYLIVFSIPFFLLTSSPVWGATYYMRADGKAANKPAATSCSSASTAMSVATHNAQTFSPDDIIYLCSDGGNFTSTITAPSSGATGHPITYANAPSETPVIDMSHTYGSAAWTNLGGGIYSTVYYASFLTEDDVPMVDCDDATLTKNSDWNTTNCNWFFDSSTRIIYYRPTDWSTGGTPSSHTIRTIAYDGMDILNLSNITIYGLTINYAWYGIGIGQTASPPTNTATNVIIHDNTFFRNNWCIFGVVAATGTVSNYNIYNNTISYSNSGISEWANPGGLNTGFQIHNNTITHHFSYGLDDSTAWTGYRVSYWFTDHEGISFQDVQNSQVYNNSVSMVFSNTTTLNNPDYSTRAFYIFINPGAVDVSGNSFLRNYASGYFSQAFYISGSGNNGIENNIYAYNVAINGKVGTVGFNTNIVTPGAPAGGMNYWVNNTMYWRSYGIAINSYSSGSWTLANNIEYVHDGGVYVIVDSNIPLTNLTFRNNIYYGYAGFMWGNYGKTWAQWQALGTLYDTIGSTLGTNPLFTDGSGNYSLASDFTLQSTSPAKWAGIYIAGLTSDYAGNPVHNPPSIGAYEYGTTPPKIPTGVRVFPR